MINPVKLAAGPQIKWLLEKNVPDAPEVPVINKQEHILNPLKMLNGSIIKPYTPLMNTLSQQRTAKINDISGLQRILTQRQQELRKFKKNKTLQTQINNILKNLSNLESTKKQIERQFKIEEQGGN